MIKNMLDNAGDTRDMGWIPELGRSPGGQNGNPPELKKKTNPPVSSLLPQSQAKFHILSNNINNK